MSLLGYFDANWEGLRVCRSSFSIVWFLVPVFGIGIVLLDHSWSFERKATQVGYPSVVGSLSLMSKSTEYVIYLRPLHHLLSATYSLVSQILWGNLFKMVSARNWNLYRELRKAPARFYSMLSAFYMTIFVLFGILLSRMGMYCISLAWSSVDVACLFPNLKLAVELEMGWIQIFLCFVPLILPLCLVGNRLGEPRYVVPCTGWHTHLVLPLCLALSGLEEPGYVAPCYGWQTHLTHRLIVGFEEAGRKWPSSGSPTARKR